MTQENPCPWKKLIFTFLFSVWVLNVGVRLPPLMAAEKNPSGKEPRSLYAYVFDERFSVVRAKPDLNAFAIRRLRVGHRVFLLMQERTQAKTKFRRIVVSRRQVVWIPAAAIAAPGVPGDDEKLYRFALTQPADRALITLAILTRHFDRSLLRPSALLQLGKQAEEVARQISVRADRKFRPEDLSLSDGMEVSDLFANFSGLDRFESFGIKFAYETGSDRYVYRGDAYEELLRKYPRRLEAKEAKEAKERLTKIREKTSKQQ